MTAASKNDRQILLLASAAQWESWFVENAEATSPVWLKISKQQSINPSVTYAEALDVALCFGWIDGQKDKFDDIYWLQRFSRRTAKSPWSQINREKAEKLIAQARVTAQGLAEIDRAKADGRWEKAYASSRSMELPADFLELLEQHPQAKAFFQSLNRANLFAIYYRLQTAKKPETRQKRLDLILDMMKGRKTFHP